MKKKAWPWTGSTDFEMGAGTISKDTQERPTLAVNESHSPSNVPPGYSGGMISPISDNLSNYAKDKRKSKKSADIDVLNDGDSLARFTCDVAEDMQEKITGLQSYDNLSENAGLIFEYKKPEDVVYHMGTVKFPIDIIFIDKDDLIKKIYKNIQPGTLGTFGCAGVKNVLEICGGLSDRLGISDGNKILISRGNDSKDLEMFNRLSKSIGVEKNVIIKYSNLGRNRVNNWNDIPIVTLNSKIKKFADKDKPLSDFILNFYNKKSKDVNVFDFDGLIERSPTIRVYKTSEEYDGFPQISLGGKTVSLVKDAAGNELFKDFNIQDLATQSLKKDSSIILGTTKSFSGFLKSSSLNGEDFKMFSELRKSAYNNDLNTVIVTRMDNPAFIKEMILSKYANYFGDHINVSVLKIDKNADYVDVIEHIRKRYGNKNINLFSDDSVLKRAGEPISESVKENAKKAYKLLEQASGMMEKSLEAMKNNLSEYNRINVNPESIKGTKGQYNESVKSNSKHFRNMLIKIRDAIRIFNKIKDISTTLEIIDSLTSSSKDCSDSIEEIFKLIDEIETPEFITKLTEKVSAYEKRIEDLRSSLDKGKNYINSDILGLIILSE